MYFRLQLKFRKTYFDTKQTISTSSANFQSSYIPRLLLTLMCEKLENIQRKEALKPGIDVSCQKDHILSWRELVSDSRLHKYALLTPPPPPKPHPPLSPPPQKKIMENHLFLKRSLHENEFNLELPPPEQKNQCTKRNQKNGPWTP